MSACTGNSAVETSVAAEGQLFVGVKDGGTWSLRRLRVAGADTGDIGRYVRGFGEDLDGELYVLTSNEAGPTGALFGAPGVFVLDAATFPALPSKNLTLTIMDNSRRIAERLLAEGEAR